MRSLFRSDASRLVSCFSFTFALGVFAAAGPSARADEALAPAPAPDGTSVPDQQMRNDVDAYFHYSWIARYDIASQFAQKITGEAAADPAGLIPVLADVAKRHDPNTEYM